MPNGACCITAEENLTVQEALLKSNRFKDINLKQSRLEHQFMNADHNQDTRFVNWKDSSLDYVNCHLFFHTDDENFLKKVASSTHNFDIASISLKDCGFCNKFIVTKLRKCRLVFKVYLGVQIFLTHFCTLKKNFPPNFFSLYG